MVILSLAPPSKAVTVREIHTRSYQKYKRCYPAAHRGSSSLAIANGEEIPEVSVSLSTVEVAV
jgi:hypothetical protein